METESFHPPAVKDSCEENSPVFPAEIPGELSEKVRRFNGYVRGCFSNGKPYEQMRFVRRKFAKARGLSWDHVDRVSRVWMKWTTEFKFSRHRFERSTCIIITPARRATVISLAEVRRRLAKAIQNYVAKSGTAHIGPKFLRGFHERYGLPAEQIFGAWRSLYFIPGCVCQWIGRGRKRYLRVRTEPAAAAASSARQLGGNCKNLKTAAPAGSVAGRVSLRQNASGISPPTGGNDLKTGAAPDRLPNRSSAPSAQPGGLGDESTTAAPGLDDSGGDAAHRAARPYAREPGPQPNRHETPGFFRWKSAREPLHVCNRYVSGEALRRKAAWLSFTVLLQAHAARPRVKFGEPHALNFCDRALRQGFLDSEICAAYQVGLDEAQASAEKDLEMADRRDTWQRSEDERAGRVGFRDPSQVISRAWIRLGADGRTAEERWARFFALHPVTPPASAGLEKSRPTTAAPASSGAPGSYFPAGTAMRKTRSGSSVAKWAPRTVAELPPEITAAEKLARRAAKLPDTAPALLKLQRKDHVTFEQHMTARGLTLQALMKLTRAQQQEFVREALRSQKG